MHASGLRDMGLGPETMRLDNVVMLIPGARVPYVFLLRDTIHTWTLVDECYVHEVMYGEAFQNTEFRL